MMVKNTNIITLTNVGIKSYITSIKTLNYLLSLSPFIVFIILKHLRIRGIVCNDGISNYPSILNKISEIINKAKSRRLIVSLKKGDQNAKNLINISM
jgi:hypothetical protein